MKNIIQIILALLIFGGTSCTNMLWKDYEPQWVWVPSSESTEANLQSKGVEYKRYKSDQLDGYLVKKSSLRKIGDVTIRALATPITVTIDGVMICSYLFVVCGGLKMFETRQ
ncbi:MAG: hypothetical protein WCO77_05135 [bacterium]